MQTLNMTALAALLPATPLSIAPAPLWIGNLLATAIVTLILVRRRLRGIPRDLEDVARIDGCGFWGICCHVLLPQMRTAFALIGIFILVAAWDDFMAALIDAHPQPIHPFSFSNGSVGEALAGSLLLTPLVIAAFLFAWHYFAKSRAPRAVKAG